MFIVLDVLPGNASTWCQGHDYQKDVSVRGFSCTCWCSVFECHRLDNMEETRSTFDELVGHKTKTKDGVNVSVYILYGGKCIHIKFIFFCCCAYSMLHRKVLLHQLPVYVLLLFTLPTWFTVHVSTSPNFTILPPLLF